MLQGVIFDKDGTLFDFRQSWAGWVERLVAGLTADREEQVALADAIGFDLPARRFRRDSPVIAGTADDIADALEPYLPGLSREGLIERMNATAAETTMAEAVPLIPTLSALRARGLRIGLATNDSEAPARAHLAAHDLTGLFDFVAGYDSGWGGKPAPGMLTAFVERFGLKPARVAMVGDSRHDLIAGRTAGMLTVAVLTGIAEAEDLADLADVVLPDIGSLGDWIDALQAV